MQHISHYRPILTVQSCSLVAESHILLECTPKFLTRYFPPFHPHMFEFIRIPACPHYLHQICSTSYICNQMILFWNLSDLPHIWWFYSLFGVLDFHHTYSQIFILIKRPSGLSRLHAVWVIKVFFTNGTYLSTVSHVPGIFFALNSETADVKFNGWLFSRYPKTMCS